MLITIHMHMDNNKFKENPAEIDRLLEQAADSAHKQFDRSEKDQVVTREDMLLLNKEGDISGTVSVQTQPSYEMDLPMLDALLSGDKLIGLHDNCLLCERAARTLYDSIEKEHEFMLKNEPHDQFHACVLLGALNLLAGMLEIK